MLVSVLTTEYIVLGRAENGWKELKRVKYGIKAGKTYKMKVKAPADEISVFVNDYGTPKLSVSDGRFRYGAVGTRVSNLAASFDNVEIDPIVFDKFEGNLVDWYIYDGGFDARTGEMQCSNKDSGKIIFRPIFNDFTFEGDLTLATNNGNAGFIFRATSLGQGADTYNGYYAGIGGNGDIILGASAHKWRSIKTVKGNIRAG